MAHARKAHKYIPPTTPGKCPYCKRHVKSLEDHIHDKHLKKSLA